jgi:hypothetical protein
MYIVHFRNGCNAKHFTGFKKIKTMKTKLNIYYTTNLRGEETKE